MWKTCVILNTETLGRWGWTNKPESHSLKKIGGNQDHVIVTTIIVICFYRDSFPSGYGSRKPYDFGFQQSLDMSPRLQPVPGFLVLAMPGSQQHQGLLCGTQTPTRGDSHHPPALVSPPKAAFSEHQTQVVITSWTSASSPVIRDRSLPFSSGITYVKCIIC